MWVNGREVVGLVDSGCARTLVQSTVVPNLGPTQGHHVTMCAWGHEAYPRTEVTLTVGDGKNL